MQSTQAFFIEVFSVTLIWGVLFLVWWFLHKRSEERCNTENEDAKIQGYLFESFPVSLHEDSDGEKDEGI